VPDPRPTILDTAVTLFLVVATLAAVGELVRTTADGDTARTIGSLVAAVGLMTALVVTWRAQRRLLPQVAGLAAIAAVAWASGMDPTHYYAYLAIMLLIGIVFRHGERLRLDRNRADLLADAS
jgi:hypothetical protein